MGNAKDVPRELLRNSYATGGYRVPSCELARSCSWLHPWSCKATPKERRRRSRHSSAFLGAEQWHTHRGSEAFPTNLNPVFDDRCCTRVDPDSSAPISFAVQDRNGADVQIDVLGLKIEGFADS